MYDPNDAFATTEDDNDQDHDHDYDYDYDHDHDHDDTDVIDDVDTDVIARAGYAATTVPAAPALTRLEQAKLTAQRLWHRPATRWVALAVALAVLLAAGGTWSVLDTRAKETAAAELSLAQAAHATALRNTDTLVTSADEIAAAAEPFGLEGERTTLTDATQTLRDDINAHRKPGTVTDDIRTHTSKIYPLATPVREALDGVLAGVDAATTAKLDGAPLVSDEDKAPTVEAMTAVTEAFGALTEVPTALTALAAAHTDLQGKQDAAQAAAEAEAARIAAEEAAAAATAEQAARATGGSSAGSTPGTGGTGARPGTGNSGRPSTGGARPGTGGGTGGGTNPGTGGGGGAPGTGGGNPGGGGGGGTGPAPYSSADAASAVRAAHGGSAALNDCDVINSGSFTPGSMISPARHLIAAGGSLGWKAWAEGGRGYVTFYACY